MGCFVQWLMMDQEAKFKAYREFNCCCLVRMQNFKILVTRNENERWYNVTTCKYTSPQVGGRVNNY